MREKDDEVEGDDDIERTSFESQVKRPLAGVRARDLQAGRQAGPSREREPRLCSDVTECTGTRRTKNVSLSLLLYLSIAALRISREAVPLFFLSTFLPPFVIFEITFFRMDISLG